MLYPYEFAVLHSVQDALLFSCSFGTTSSLFTLYIKLIFSNLFHPHILKADSLSVYQPGASKYQ